MRPTFCLLRIVPSLACLCTWLCGIAAESADGVRPFRKKVIACSWDLGVFSVSDVLSNKAAFAALPIDGARLSANGVSLPDGSPCSYTRPLTSPLWPKGVFAPLVAQLREATAIPSLAHSFIGFSINPFSKDSRLDWRDDSAWGRGFSNVAQLAALAREGGLEGLAMDPEDYAKKRQYMRIESDPPYDVAAALARRRGRELSQALFGNCPRMTLLSFWLFSSCRRYLDEADPAAAAREAGDLWVPFLNGVLDGLPPEARLVDGDETSYNYCAFTVADLMTYSSAACANRSLVALVDPANRARYRGQVLTGCALYMDRFTNPEGRRYYTGPTSGSRLLSFDERLCGALRAADEYVWLWSEKYAYIDWKRHAPPIIPIRFAKDTTWDDALPGAYDAIWSASKPHDFLARRFHELRGRGTCTNFVRRVSHEISGKSPYGRQLAAVPVARGERYVVECTNAGEQPGVEIAFHGKNGRHWHIPSVKFNGCGTFSRIVRILPETERMTVRAFSAGGTNAVARFSGVGVYRLPQEEGYRMLKGNDGNGGE